MGIIGFGNVGEDLQKYVCLGLRILIVSKSFRCKDQYLSILFRI